MQTGRAIIIAAVVVAASGAATAWATTPRYTLTNPGAGLTVRLDRSTGDMIGCRQMECAPIVANGQAVHHSDPWAGFPWS